MDPFLGEIRLFSMSYAPKGWAACQGQMLSVQSNAALFSLLGTLYGGDGTSTFALPDLRGKAPVYGGTTYIQGKAAGEENHTLALSEMPEHTHIVSASTNAVDATSPKNATWANTAGGYAAAADAVLNPAAISIVGGNEPHNKMQPYLALNFCIATQGIYPPRP